MIVSSPLPPPLLLFLSYKGGFTNCTTVDAYKAAHKGFLGPLCYPCSHPPCTPPPGPGPNTTRVSLQSTVGTGAAMCLAPTPVTQSIAESSRTHTRTRSTVSKAIAVGMVPCSTSGVHDWALQKTPTNGSFVLWEGATGKLKTTGRTAGDSILSAVRGAGACLRPVSSAVRAGKCGPGVELVVGKCSTKCPGFQLVGDQLRSTGCPGYCAAVSLHAASVGSSGTGGSTWPLGGSGGVVLGECSGTNTHGWKAV